LRVLPEGLPIPVVLVKKEIAMRFSRLLALTVAGLVLAQTQASFGVDPWGLKPGAVELKSAGPLVFGPDGILFVGDPAAASVVAIATDDAKAGSAKGSINITGFQQKLSAVLGAPAEAIRVADLAVNPASRTVYVSVSSGESRQPALVRVAADGKLSKVALNNVKHSRAQLASAPDAQARGRRGNPRDQSITDLAFVEGKLFVAGLARGESPSAVRELPFPFADREAGTSIEIYHAAHGRVEDDAVVRTFAPLVIDGEPMLLAGFTCTPLVKFPLSELAAGKKVRGTTVAELGNRNQPLDMIVYSKGGKDFVLMSNSARGVMKISTDRIRENAGLTEPVKGGGTAGQSFETIEELVGVEQLDRLDEERAIILATAEGSLDLRTIELP
jgi:hypothetical protein